MLCIQSGLIKKSGQVFDEINDLLIVFVDLIEILYGFIDPRIKAAQTED